MSAVACTLRPTGGYFLLLRVTKALYLLSYSRKNVWCWPITDDQDLELNFLLANTYGHPRSDWNCAQTLAGQSCPFKAIMQLPYTYRLFFPCDVKNTCHPYSAMWTPLIWQLRDRPPWLVLLISRSWHILLQTLLKFISCSLCIGYCPYPNPLYFLEPLHFPISISQIKLICP